MRSINIFNYIKLLFNFMSSLKLIKFFLSIYFYKIFHTILINLHKPDYVLFDFNSNSKLLNDNINRIKRQLIMISFLINKNFNIRFIIY